jgi:hypothetical protein
MNASAAVAGAGDPGPVTPIWRRWWVWGPVLLLLLITGVWLALKHGTTGKRAEVASGYLAHVVCSCRFVGNRDMASCDTDREPGMEIVKVTENSSKRSITASVPFFASRTATYDPEYGCALDKP